MLKKRIQGMLSQWGPTACLLACWVVFLGALAPLTTEAIEVGPLLSIATGSGYQVDPRAAYDSVNQRFLITWLDNPDSPSGWNAAVFGRLLNKDGSFFGSPFQIGARSTYITYEEGNSRQIAYDPFTQRFLTCWNENAGSNGVLYGQMVSADGTLYGNKLSLANNLSMPSGAVGGEVVFNPVSGNYLTTAVQFAPVFQPVWGRVVNPDGSLPGNPFLIRDADVGCQPCRPRLAVNSQSGRYLVTYQNYADHKLWGQVSDVGGTAFGQPFIIYDGGGNNPGQDGIAADPQHGRFLQAFNCGSGQMINEDGSLLGSVINFAPNFPLINYIAVEFDRGWGQSLVSFLDSNINQKVWGQYLDAYGSLSETYFAINEYGGSNIRSAYGDRASGTLVLWEGSDYNIYARLVHRNPVPPPVAQPGALLLLLE